MDWQGKEPMKDTTETIRTILTDILMARRDEILPEVTLTSLGADSLDMEEILQGVDFEFGIVTPRSIAEESTVGDLIALADALLAKKGARL